MKISINLFSTLAFVVTPVVVNAEDAPITQEAESVSCVYSGNGRQHLEECGVPLKIMTKGHDVPAKPFTDLTQEFASKIKQLQYVGTTANKTVEQFIQENVVDGMAILYKGHLVFEEYHNTQTIDTRHHMASATKSFLGVVAAWLVHEGFLDENELVTTYLTDLPEGNPLEGATVRQVMDMSTAFRWDEDGATCDFLSCWAARATALATDEAVTMAMPECFGCEFLQDYNSIAGLADFKSVAAEEGFHDLEFPPPELNTFREVIRQLQPLEEENAGATTTHGEKFTYNTPNTDILAWIVDEVLAAQQNNDDTNLPPTADKFFAEMIWSKLGQDHDAFLTMDAERTPYWGAGSAITTRDALRYGEMVRLGGKNNRGEQIIPEEVIEGIWQVDEDPEAVLLNQLQYNRSEGFFRNKDIQGRSGWTYRNMHRIIPGRYWIQEGFWGNYIWVDRKNDLVIALQSSNLNFAAVVISENDSMLFTLAEAFEKGLLPEVPNDGDVEEPGDVTSENAVEDSGSMSSSSGIFSSPTATSVTFTVMMIMSCLSMMILVF